MDARAFARGFRFSRLRSLVVLDQREVDLPIRHVAGNMVARLLRLRVAEAEDLLVEVPGAQHVVDFQRDMDDTAHRWCSSMRKGVLGAGNPTCIIALDEADVRKNAGRAGTAAGPPTSVLDLESRLLRVIRREVQDVL